MLCLSRERNQTVTLTVPPSSEPTVIEVTVVDARAGKPRLGFTAPRCVEILRDDAVAREPKWTAAAPV